MAEEEVNYASVVFKTNKNSPPEVKREEETVYDEVKVRGETTTKQTDDTNVKKEEETVYDEVKQQSETNKQTNDTKASAGLLPDEKENKRRRHYQQLACCLGILCVILVSGIIAVSVYLTTLNHEGEQNQAALLAGNHNLTDLNQKLSSENENLRRDHNNLTDQYNNLTQAYNALDSRITNLTAEKQELETQNQVLEAQKQELTTKNQELETQNQVLETQNQVLETQKQELTTKNQELETLKTNLTQEIQDMETEWNELNVSRAQWSINAYCPSSQGRQCKPCQAGWDLFQTSCYVIHDAQPADQKTWDEAQENCKEDNSDLVVITDSKENDFIRRSSWASSGNKGYWIGLRAKNGKWKWVDGSVLENSWTQQNAPTDGQCVISVIYDTWKSVKCSDKNRWICKQKALSV